MLFVVPREFVPHFEWIGVFPRLPPYTRKSVLEGRKLALLREDKDIGERQNVVVTGIPIAVAHSFSMKLSTILKAWNFPGDCLVRFDNALTDIVID